MAFSTGMAGLCSALVTCISYIVYYSFLHPLARFPGPFICSLTNLWKFWAVATDRMPDEIVKLHQKYGPVVRVGPNDLSFNSPAAIADIYKQGWQKGEFYRGFKQPEPGLFSIRDEKLHAKRKRMFALGFSMPSIRSMEGVIDSRYAILRRQLDRFAKSEQTFDLRRYITYCIVDVLGELAFGGDFGNQLAEDPSKIPPVSEALWGSCIAGQIPWAADAFAFMRDNFPTTRISEVLAALNGIVPIAVRTIKERDEKGVQRDDILGRLMAARQDKTGEPLTSQQVIAEAVTLIVGGTHTTGNSLHILFANLSRNPQHLRKVIDEIDSSLPALRPDQAAYPINGLEERLDFVNLAIKESHRKDPVGTFNMPRNVPAAGAVVAGYLVPAGAQVFANIHALHHNIETWGEDHAVYDPTRFCDQRAESLKEFVIPFMVGKRACVGQNLANANILKMLTTLLRAYEFDFVNLDEPMELICHGDSDLRTRLLVKCKRRGDLFVG